MILRREKLPALFLLFLSMVFFLSGCSDPSGQENAEASDSTLVQVDVCVYGGTSAGVIAAYTAALQNKSVLLIEPTKHLGGMSSAGLGSTDIGNKHAIRALARDFYRRVGEKYGKFEAWTFEPKVAEQVFNEYLQKVDVDVRFQHRLVSTKVEGKNIKAILVENTGKLGSELTIKAAQYIDCTYEGDLMAKSGVSYFVGREDNARYKETLNGVQLRNKHQFPDGIDPYLEEGKPESGLLPTVSPQAAASNGKGDDKLQAYNYRLCLTKQEGNTMPMPKPTSYDPLNYELLWRVMRKNNNLDGQQDQKPYEHHWQWTSFKTGFIINEMPNGKTDFNHLGGFSIDYIGQNHDYAEASYERRAEIFEEHKQFILGIFHFLTTDERVPGAIAEEAKKWGLPKDEFTDNGGWPYYLYVRETRRMLGEYIMTEHNCLADSVAKDGIALAAYTMDSHNCQRVVVDGMVKNEGNVEVKGFGPYPISYRSLVPKKEEVQNLTVPVCLSASHIAYGSIRMEPVFMVLGQVAALAAVQAMDEQLPIQEIDHRKLVELMDSNPYLDGRKPDVVLDDSQASLLTTTDDLARVQSFEGAYDTSFLWAPKAVLGSTEASFALQDVEGVYDVYAYFARWRNADETTKAQIPDSMAVVVQHKGGTTKKSMVYREVSGDLSLVGTFGFQQGAGGKISVVPLQKDKGLIADAFLLVPKQKQN